MRKYTIYGRLDGLNEYTLQCRRNKFAGNQLKQKNQKIIINNIQGEDISPLKTPIFVKFHWVEQTKRRDLDNIAFAKKFFFDTWQKMELLENDNWNYVKGFEDTFSYDKENPRIEVTILEDGEF